MRRLYFSLGKNKFWEYVLLALFLLFFCGPLMNMLLLSFAGDYEYPDVIPRSYGFKWWDYVLSKAQLVQSIGTSLVLAVVVTLLSLAVCLPAAYALARYPFRGRSAVRLSFLLTNAFPKMGIYTAMAVIFYKLNLIGTFAGVVLVHIVNTMMFMVWIPSGAFRTVHIQQEESARAHVPYGYAAHGQARHHRGFTVYVPRFHGRGAGFAAHRPAQRAHHAQ